MEKKDFLTFFFKPYEWQNRAIDVVRKKNITAVIASNKIGKSCFGANTAISWLLGYEPWCYLDKEDPLAVEVGGCYYRKSTLGIDPPVDIIVTGEDWKMHIGRTLVKEFKKWCPKGWYKTKKNEQGVEYFWEFFNGSTITLMCYTQDDDLFESFRAQGVWMDEPPPKSKYDAMSRGLLLDCGKTLMTMTPLKEAWILDEVVLSGRSDVGVIDKLMITENTDLYNSDKKYLYGLGLNEEEAEEFFNLLLYDEDGTHVKDRGHRAEIWLKEKTDGDLSKLKILKFIKDINPEDVLPRVFGEFKFLVGRVLKEFDTNIHIIKPFEIPTDWPVVAMIDFHLSLPQAVSFWAVNKQEVHYCIHEIWDNMLAEEIADEIIRKKKSRVWNIEKAFIDPLSKGDTLYMRNMLGTSVRDSFSIIEEKLSHHGITLYVASKDKESGISNIRGMLRGVNGLPTCYIFENCEQHIYEVQRWIYDENNQPVKKNDHFMENWYRYTLTGNCYKDHIINPIPVRQEYSWMAL